MNCVVPFGDQPMRRAESQLWIDLVGPFSVSDAAGRMLTPRANKAQGLLALLATSHKLCRTRTWLQDKLWSDRQQEQGSASLRQTLTTIRHALGAQANCLVTEGGRVALDPVRCAIRTRPEGVESDCEFLEGLDVRDPEFEDWLRDRRREFCEAAAVERPDPTDGPPGRAFGRSPSSGEGRAVSAAPAVTQRRERQEAALTSALDRLLDVLATIDDPHVISRCQQKLRIAPPATRTRPYRVVGT